MAVEGWTPAASPGHSPGPLWRHTQLARPSVLRAGQVPAMRRPLRGRHDGASSHELGTQDMHKSRVAVIASAQTELRAAWNSAQHIDLISAVVTEVFKGTGLTLADVDFVIDSGSDVLDGRSISNCGFLGAMGAHHKEESRVEEDGLWAAVYGTTKILAGGADIGLIIAYSKPSESDVNVFYSSQVEPFYQRPVGFDHRAASGIQAQRYLAEHKVLPADLARLVARRWSDAERYGRVLTAGVPTEQDVLKSSNLATPLKALMMSRPVDGAVAVLLANDRIARRVTHTGVRATRRAIRSFASSTATAPSTGRDIISALSGVARFGDLSTSCSVGTPAVSTRP